MYTLTSQSNLKNQIFLNKGYSAISRVVDEVLCLVRYGDSKYIPITLETKIS